MNDWQDMLTKKQSATTGNILIQMHFLCSVHLFTWKLCILTQKSYFDYNIKWKYFATALGEDQEYLVYWRQAGFRKEPSPFCFTISEQPCCTLNYYIFPYPVTSIIDSWPSLSFLSRLSKVILLSWMSEFLQLVVMSRKNMDSTDSVTWIHKPGHIISSWQVLWRGDRNDYIIAPNIHRG